MWHTAERRFVRHVCLRNPFLQLLLGIPSIHSLPEAGSWERQHNLPALHYACIMPIPSLQLQEKNLSHAEKQRVWSRGYGLQDLYRFVTMQWLCSQLCYVTAANQWTVVEIERLATMGWKWGCQPFSCRCSQNVTHCRKEICSTCLFKESIPATPFGNFNHPPPARSRFERQHAPPPLHCGCIMPIPSLQLQEKTCLMQRSRGFGHGVMASKICYNAVIVLSVVLCDCCKPMNSCRDWAFSLCGLEVELPAFQLPIFPKCDTLPKGDLFDMFV